MSILRYIFLLLIAAVQYTACFYDNEMFDGINKSKSVWFMLVLGFTIILSSFARRIRLEINSVDIAVSLFLLYGIISNTIYDENLVSYKNIQEAGLVTFYFMAKQAYGSKDFSVTLYIITILLLTCTQISIAVLQWYGFLPSYHSHFRITGFFFNTAPFAILLSALLAFCFAVFMFNGNKAIKISAITILACGIPVLLIALSRSALIGLFFAIIFILELRFKILRKAAAYIRGIKLRLATGLLVAIAAFFISSYIYSIKKDSANGRLLTWKLSAQMIYDHPLTGTGNFSAKFLTYQSNYFYSRPSKITDEGWLADDVRFAFNDLIQIAVEKGLPGLALFIFLLIVIIRASVKLISSKNLAAKPAYVKLILPIVIIIVIIISGMFSYPLSMLPLQVIFYSSLALFSANYGALSKASFSLTLFNSINPRVLAPAKCITGLFFIWYAGNINKAYTKWNEIANLGYEEDIRNLEPYHFILKQDFRYIVKTAEYYLDQEEYITAINILEHIKIKSSDPAGYYLLARAYKATKEYTKAEKQYLFLVYAFPAHLMPKYLLAKLYFDSGQTIKWKEYSNLVLRFRPKVTSALTEQMKLDIQTLINKKKIINNYLDD